MTIAECNAPIPEHVVSIIRKRGLKKIAVAKKAGCTYQEFSYMLNGRKIIKPSDILAISDALGVNVNDLFYGEGNSSNRCRDTT